MLCDTLNLPPANPARNVCGQPVAASSGFLVTRAAIIVLAANRIVGAAIAALDQTGKKMLLPRLASRRFCGSGLNSFAPVADGPPLRFSTDGIP